MKKILFISHDANRAGAQILLLRFVKKLAQYPDFQITILLKHGGPLVSEFEAVAPTFFWNPPAPPPNRLLGRLLRHRQHPANLLPKLEAEGFDLVVSNTVTNGDLLEELQSLRCPVVTYAHELEIGISMYTSPEAFARTLCRSDFFMACSRVQRQRYIANYGIDPARIDYLPSLLPDEATNVDDLIGRSADLRRQLNLPVDALLVGCMGTFDWRKGVDVFIQLARLVPPQIQDIPVYFIWVGGSHQHVEFKTITEDARRLGLQERLIFIENRPNPLEYMACFDVFALPSREEPYPLVVLEAALLAKPIVCFDQSGGAREVVEDDAGFICDYLDINRMADCLTTLLTDETLRQRMGQVARQKVQQRHSEQRAMNVLIGLLQKYMAPVPYPTLS
ncbi:MAG: glycosyltransferase family 4 protein [Cytophagaceae bacterium]|nr:glycosyltransferase family 4 protein [Cytophagaceae bacterium]